MANSNNDTFYNVPLAGVYPRGCWFRQSFTLNRVTTGGNSVFDRVVLFMNPQTDKSTITLNTPASTTVEATLSALEDIQAGTALWVPVTSAAMIQMNTPIHAFRFTNALATDGAVKVEVLA